MNIILFGPPGVGKGTQGQNLVKDLNLFKISSGDVLRDEIKKKTTLGIEIKKIIDLGKLVSDEIINDLIENILSNKKYSNRLIFDGYPRNLYQAKHLAILIKKYNQKILCVLNLVGDKNIIIKRIVGRETCSNCGLIFNSFFYPSTVNNHTCESKFLQKRSDDNEEVIKKRFEIYVKERSPILDYYKNLNILYEIDGMADIPSIYKEIRRVIHSLET